MWHKLGYIGNEQTVVPATISFGGGLKNLEHKLKDREWFCMQDLHSAVKGWLQKTGAKLQPDFDEIAKTNYRSLARFFSEIDSSTTFSWLYYGANCESQLFENEDPAFCSFIFRSYLRVPASWGQKVLAFAKQGIVAAEKDASGKWFLIMWDGMRVPQAEEIEYSGTTPSARSAYHDENWLMQMLYDLGFLDESKKDVIEDARKLAEKMNVLLSDLLVTNKILTAGEILTAKGAHFDIPLIDLPREQISDEAMKIVPKGDSEKYAIMPVRVNQSELVIAISDPAAFDTIDSLQQLYGTATRSVYFQLASKADILAAIDKWYPKEIPSLELPNCS